MKNYLLFVSLLAVVSGCETKEANPDADVLGGSCTYDSRKTTRTLSNVKGTVNVTPAGQETWTDIYVDGDTSTPYCACNLPLSFTEDGSRILFSAEIKEIYANERWRCQPIKLTSLQAISSTQK